MNNVKRQLTTIYSRVVGWYTPVNNYNPGKQSEFKDRVVFDHEKSMAHKTIK